jgi:hypothetical protein
MVCSRTGFWCLRHVVLYGVVSWYITVGRCPDPVKKSETVEKYYSSTSSSTAISTIIEIIESEFVFKSEIPVGLAL